MFVLENLHHQDEKDLALISRCKYVHLKTHQVCDIIQQNIDLILRQL